MIDKTTPRRRSRVSGTMMAAAVAGMMLSGTALRAEEVLKAVSAFPVPMFWTQDFQDFVADVNEKGKGVVSIQMMGGPEVVPSTQQIDAVKRGIIDIQYGPATYHLGSAPEIDALVGSNVTPQDAREDGGFELMQTILQDRLGVRLLSMAQTGLEFYIWTVDKPKITEDGNVDLDGMRLRSQPIYASFFEGLGAVPVSAGVPDVYTGLERGTFDGIGWPIAGVTDLSWDKYLKYRIDPGFFNSDLVIVMNPDSYADLSDEARAIIDQAAMDYERSSRERLAEVTAETDKKVRDAGIEVITLEGSTATDYLDSAFGSAWARLKASDTTHYDALRAAFYHDAE
ncbi:C4-dicarboxylate ABC transporter substrate-binding protein [Pseudooceanicola sediminis]|uniref:C4-dicarboxylate ABC transporter substrate-binding protein n=1 Tax=Pseudooceanicola sediminis TaxID=2211117 RepID=A0A399IXZ8_9RHOB|nr:TRAP transporter substrate-binding protein DctP [Pseudooceanicola sediminis]KAA2314947.1 C4-dicarboxylate ABC transporter substrate-binding protein [Puniceibacterium sp. HSS470]RII37317.1 C4-dicarboxylate ABC transporter substrate-binding protein [Pseudooceanicola sediminis]|tara:strand:- start:9021 stop:10043 length:1023 start_codon:yes stop_codon:yes gene_type:complete